METDRLSILTAGENPLGNYLKSCRAKRDPIALGFTSKRRRTPGLRREEVAQLANVSATWYTWLEQGRGGSPSVDVLEGIAQALALSSVEREHLFLLAHDRPPEVRYGDPAEVSPRLRRVLDSLDFSPAYVKNATWDVLAWNPAAAAVLHDYGKVPPGQRNIIELFFNSSAVRERVPNWQGVARFLVAAFRADIVRAGASARANALVERLRRQSPEFQAMWLENEVVNFGEGNKVINHPVAGQIILEYSSFSVDGQPNLGLIIFSPATPEDVARIRSLLS